MKLPKITFINYLKEYPNATCWRQWFSIQRLWSGKLIYINVRHYSLQFDFRRDVLGDLMK